MHALWLLIDICFIDPPRSRVTQAKSGSSSRVQSVGIAAAVYLRSQAGIAWGNTGSRQLAKNSNNVIPDFMAEPPDHFIAKLVLGLY